MNPTITIGRVAGVRIGFNWSWGIVFALIVWSLADTVFPAQNPGLAGGVYVAMAFVATLLFFASLLLHELGHAVQARREGMPVTDITLWLFGGVARFRGEFPNAGAEFRIAIAGPLVTAFLAFVFLGGAAVLPLVEPVEAVSIWLGYISVLLLAFNLLPAIPLDGGRVLRAALWKRTGDFRRATRVATEISRLLAIMLVALGVALVVAGDPVGGVWLAFIGWFLLLAATAEARHLLVNDVLAGLRVHDLMEPHPAVAPAGQTLAEFVDAVAGAARFTAYPVMESGRVVGVLPFARVLQTPRQEWGTRRVSECMLGLEEIPRFVEEESAAEALQELAEAPLRRGVVLDDGRLVGLLSISDFARVLVPPAGGRRGPEPLPW